MEVLNLIVPVFLIIILGAACRYFNFFGKESADLLVRFALYIAIPALMINTIAHEPTRKFLNWPYIISYGGGTLLTFLFAFLILKLFRKKILIASALGALAGSMSNAGFVALPLLLALFGNKIAIYAAISIVVVVIVLYPLCIITIELGQKHNSQSETFSKILKQIFSNPMIVSTCLGIFISLTGCKIPLMIDNFLSTLGAALTPCALFAIGLEMDIKTLKDNAVEILWLTLVKLILLPAIVFVLAMSYHLSPMLIVTATISAAVPTAKSAYVLANNYQNSKDLVASVISATTIVSIITMFLILFAFGHLWPEILTMHVPSLRGA